MTICGLQTTLTLAVTMSPARAILRVAGYEMTTAGLPEQVTQFREI